VIERLLAGAGGLHGNAQHLLELPLTDVVGQTAWPQGVLAAEGCDRIRASADSVVLGAGEGIHQPGRRWRMA